MSTSVFVLGATGYIGRAIAQSFRRAGYKVYGSTRSEKKTQQLLQDEVIPVIGDTSEPSKFKEVLLQSSIIIDAVGYAPESPHGLKFFEYFVSLTKEREREEKRRIRNHLPLYVFTSGIMIYASGERVDFPVDETHLVHPRDPVEMIPKKEIEDSILACTDIRTVVMRPGFVYGGNGGVLGGLYFDVKPDEKIVLWGGLEKRWSWIHKDDLGDAYVRVAEAGSVVDNQIFNIANPNDHPTWIEVKYSAAKAAGWKGKKEEITSVPVPEDQKRIANWEWNVMVNPQKAMNLLGWRPKHLSFVQEIDQYYATWKSFQQ